MILGFKNWGILKRRFEIERERERDDGRLACEGRAAREGEDGAEVEKEEFVGFEEVLKGMIEDSIEEVLKAVRF